MLLAFLSCSAVLMTTYITWSAVEGTGAPAEGRGFSSLAAESWVMLPPLDTDGAKEGRYRDGLASGSHRRQANVSRRLSCIQAGLSCPVR